MTVTLVEILEIGIGIYLGIYLAKVKVNQIKLFKNQQFLKREIEKLENKHNKLGCQSIKMPGVEFMEISSDNSESAIKEFFSKIFDRPQKTEDLTLEQQLHLALELEEYEKAEKLKKEIEAIKNDKNKN